MSYPGPARDSELTIIKIHYIHDIERMLDQLYASRQEIDQYEVSIHAQRRNERPQVVLPRQCLQD